MKIDIAQLKFIDQKLRNICTWLEDETGLEFEIKSLYRIGDKGVHGTLPLRAIDLGCKDKIIGKDIETLINNEWCYDLKRSDLNCALLHDSGSGLHLHLQVHPRTFRVD